MKLKKYASNPILTKNPKNQWEELCVLNPAVIKGDDGKFYMLYRAAGNDKQHYDENEKANVSSLTVGNMAILNTVG